MITKTEQTRILKDLKTIRDAASPEYQARAWQNLLIGAVVALGTDVPPHWHMNVLCGRADRLLEGNVQDSGQYKEKA